MLKIKTLNNGLVVIIKEISHVESAAYELLIPGGLVCDSPGYEGSSLILAELTARGAGKLNSRQLSEAFDKIGVAHSESASVDSFAYRGSLLASKLEQALSLLACMVTDPVLPDSEIDSIRSLFLQDLAALADNPMRKVMIELGSRYFPQPWGRCSQGTESGLVATNLAELKRMHAHMFKPQGAVLSIAGNVNSENLFLLLEKLFANWTGKSVELPNVDQMPAHRHFHIHTDSAQMQIALSYPSAKMNDPHYYAAKVATSILSGGMFGRLFIEIREKKGLCYTVRARHSGGKYFGAVSAYAGTTTERSSETFDLLVKELRGLKGSVTSEELERSKTDLKSGKIIGEESTSAQAAANAGDWWLLGRVRTLDEILEGISAVNAEAIDHYLVNYPVSSFVSVTLGAKEIAVPV